MKVKQIFSLVLALFVVFYFSSCGDDSIKDMDNEPNNSIEEAVLLELDTVPFSTKIQEEGDVDWFKVEIPAQGYYSIMASSIPEEIGAEVKFALFEEWEGKKVKDISGWLDFPAVMHIPKAGTYYFRIKDDYSDAFSEEAIILKTQFVEEFDKYEMNNVIKSAQVINLNQSLELFIYPKKDVDFFKIEAPGKKGYIKAMVKEDNDGVNLEIKFVQYNEWADNKISDLTGWLEFPAAVLIPDEGDVYFIVQDDYSDGSSTEVFTLKIDYVAQMDSMETNNTFKDAKVASRGDTLNLAIFPKGDEDWFVITIEEGETLEFLAKDWDGAINPEIKFHTLNDKNELANYSSWENFPYTFN
ncbi:MAG: hypothetical protein U9Q83_03720, partial [Bacteroidota bacterium]|nr:hypothetical protein [Bacteroidota bacterium]